MIILRENLFIENNSEKGKCPVMHGANTESENSVMSWWPNALNLDILHQQVTKTNHRETKHGVFTEREGVFKQRLFCKSYRHELHRGTCF
ncbi:hypothetical protein [Prolixibacter sp. SD074]|jgi:catalase (peroxidase I)|uniref:hypothetical protein n=1 Tax=Prolixibacter sp. SD074 TaxID=2652391 RepID=UPI00126DAEF3|nr:hypothetical protein [Prolixibacter sp. SD074]GET29432.1 hypothetical protein SD074_16340 [Prolixibacter sp. SD074]